MKVYGLYFNEKRMELKIAPWITPKQSDEDIPIYRHNDCYYISTSIPELRAKGEELLVEWKEKTIKRLNALNELKIKTKY